MILIQAALLAFTCTLAEGALKCTATNGMDCVFPFKRPGSPKMYTECAPSVRSDRHWCATKVKDDMTYDTWSFCRKDTCDIENVDELFEGIRPRDECLTCLTSNDALDCVPPCVTNPNKLACFNCLLKSNAGVCRRPCVGKRTGDPTEKVDDADAAVTDGICAGSLTYTGPYGDIANPTPGIPFTDRAAAASGNISTLSFRTSDVINEMKVTYGKANPITHGGTGGSASNPYVPQGKIIKVEGYTFEGTQPTFVRSLRFTAENGQVSPWFGQLAPDSSSYFSKSMPNCFLRFFEGYTFQTPTTGAGQVDDTDDKKTTTKKPTNPTQSKFKVNQLTFVWCC